MERRLLTDIVIGQNTIILQLLSRKNQTLLVRRNAFLVLNLRLDISDGVRALHLECNSLSRERFDEDLHLNITRYNFLSALDP